MFFVLVHSIHSNRLVEQHIRVVSPKTSPERLFRLLDRGPTHCFAAFSLFTHAVHILPTRRACDDSWCGSGVGFDTVGKASRQPQGSRTRSNHRDNRVRLSPPQSRAHYAPYKTARVICMATVFEASGRGADYGGGGLFHGTARPAASTPPGSRLSLHSLHAAAGHEALETDACLKAAWGRCRLNILSPG